MSLNVYESRLTVVGNCLSHLPSENSPPLFFDMLELLVSAFSQWLNTASKTLLRLILVKQILKFGLIISNWYIFKIIMKGKGKWLFLIVFSDWLVSTVVWCLFFFFRKTWIEGKEFQIDQNFNE